MSLHQLDSNQFRTTGTSPDVTSVLPTKAPQQNDSELILTAKMLALLGVMAPTNVFAAITPNDSADLPTPARSIYVGGTGNVVVKNAAGASVTFTAVPAGTILPIATARVMATGTTATLLIAL